MHRQPHITKTIRALVVDWLVKMLEGFELNHETLYLATKMVDLFLSRVIVRKEKIQLVAAAAMLMASKYDVSYRLYKTSSIYKYIFNALCVYRQW